MTTILVILGIIFLIYIYIKIGLNVSEYYCIKQYSLEEFLDYYLKNPWYGISNFTFNFLIWPIGIVLNLITMKFWRPNDYIKPHFYD